MKLVTACAENVNVELMNDIGQQSIHDVFTACFLGGFFFIKKIHFERNMIVFAGFQEVMPVPLYESPFSV